MVSLGSSSTVLGKTRMPVGCSSPLNSTTVTLALAWTFARANTRGRPRSHDEDAIEGALSETSAKHPIRCNSARRWVCQLPVNRSPL